MKKIHVATDQYCFVEAESESDEELIEFHNKWNEKGKPLTFNKSGVVKKESIPTVVPIKVDSFTEESKIVEKIDHSFYHDGEKLLSPSSWIKQFYRPFKRDMISKVAAKSYGVDQKELIELWSETGAMAIDFGQAGHKALEVHDRFKHLGESAHEKKGYDISISKHPILKKIVEEFHKLNKVKGEVYPEALVTDVENGMCGIIDRLVVTGKNKCVIQDYKFNTGVEEKSSNLKPLKPYSSLDSTKLSKYRLQLSYYAQIMINLGWEVEGLQAFVYEDGWKMYEFDKLDVELN